MKFHAAWCVFAVVGICVATTYALEYIYTPEVIQRIALQTAFQWQLDRVEEALESQALLQLDEQMAARQQPDDEAPSPGPPLSTGPPLYFDRFPIFPRDFPPPPVESAESSDEPPPPDEPPEPETRAVLMPLTGSGGGGGGGGGGTWTPPIEYAAVLITVFPSSRHNNRLASPFKLD